MPCKKIKKEGPIEWWGPTTGRKNYTEGPPRPQSSTPLWDDERTRSPVPSLPSMTCDLWQFLIFPINPVLQPKLCVTLSNLYHSRWDSFNRTSRVLAGTHLQNKWLTVFHINWGSTCSSEGKPEIRNLTTWSPVVPKLNVWSGDEFSRSLFHKLGYHWISYAHAS